MSYNLKWLYGDKGAQKTEKATLERSIELLLEGSVLEVRIDGATAKIDLSEAVQAVLSAQKKPSSKKASK